MAKKKDSMALFDVISKGKQGCREADLSLPAWMRKQDDDSADSPESQVEPQAEPQVAATAEPVAGAGAPRGEQVEDARLVSTSAGRLTLSLNYVTCTVALVALILSLIMAFVVGRATAPSSSGPVLAGTAQLPGAQDIRRLPGKYYLVIKAMTGLDERSRADGENIATFFTRSGHPATVVSDSAGGRYVVWSAVPLDSPTGVKAENNAAEVRNTGRAYRPPDGSGSRYDFVECSPDGVPLYRRMPVQE